MKVLVIEDEPVYAALIERYLTGLATEIHCATSWADAQKYLGEKPDIMWVDILVPGENVNSALLRVGEVRAENSETVILVVSGAVDSDLPARAVSAGADLFIEKNNATTRNKVISLIILALLNARTRGADTEEFLIRAQQFLKEQVNPVNSACLTVPAAGTENERMKRRNFLATLGAMALLPLVKVQAKESTCLPTQPNNSAHDWQAYPIYAERPERLETTVGSVIVFVRYRFVPEGVFPAYCDGELLAYDYERIGSGRFRLRTYERA